LSVVIIYIFSFLNSCALIIFYQNVPSLFAMTCSRQFGGGTTCHTHEITAVSNIEPQSNELINS